MQNTWQVKFPQDHQPDLKEIEAFLPDPDYFCVFIAQIKRHYDPDFLFEYEEQTGWFLTVKKQQKLFFELYVDSDHFSVVVKVSQKLDDLLKPMLMVMSKQLNQEFQKSSLKNGERKFDIVVRSEEEMEDVVYLVSLRAKMIRDGKIK